MTMTAVVCAGLLSMVGIIPVAGNGAWGAVSNATADTGFAQPFAGSPHYESLAPTQVRNRGQLNRPIRREAADKIAAQLGLSRNDAFTRQQYLKFITGQGVGGNLDDAKLVDASVRIFTNTIGRPLRSSVDGHITRSVLSSYGLFVNPDGLLESLANTDAPTRKANSVIAPGGYLETWCDGNGCTASIAALYESAFTVEAISGTESQQVSGVAQLVPNTKNGVSTMVGMSMAPSIWLVNFALLYILNPSVAAKMPASWAPIPANVADAILASPTGQVPYSEYASDLR